MDGSPPPVDRSSWPQPPPSEWWLDRDVAQGLYALLERNDLSSDAFEQEIAALEDAAAVQGSAQAEVIFLLTRVRLEPAEAGRHWPNILVHRSELSVRLGRSVDLRVALMSYFLDVERHLQRPRIVEMDWVERATASAYLDEVTGLPNNRFFRDQLTREIERSLRQHAPLSLILVDADDFKLVNDRLGHERGNAVLATLGTLLRQAVRPGDLVARYGGEEFVVLLPWTPKPEAALVADAIRSAVASHPFDVEAAAPGLTLTVSLGVATAPGDAHDETGLVVAADRAMYEAKAAGKNQVRTSGASVRSYPRHKVTRPGHLKLIGAERHPIETVEIGEGGLSFRTDRALIVGTLVETAVTLRGGQLVQVAGRVVWTRAIDGDRFESAIRFVELHSKAREHLVRWLRAEAAAIDQVHVA